MFKKHVCFLESYNITALGPPSKRGREGGPPIYSVFHVR